MQTCKLAELPITVPHQLEPDREKMIHFYEGGKGRIDFFGGVSEVWSKTTLSTTTNLLDPSLNQLEISHNVFQTHIYFLLAQLISGPGQ